MPRATLDGANLKNVSLAKSELSRASFVEADLTGADLSYSDLGRANFAEALLGETSFTGAYTYLTRFEGVDLSSSTGLTQEQLDIACGDENTSLPQGLAPSAEWPCM